VKLILEKFKNYRVKIFELRPKVVFILLFFMAFYTKGQDSGVENFSKKCFVKSILVEGNKRTKTAIIVRELGVNENDSLDILTLDVLLTKRKNNIFNTNLFNKVEIIPILNGSELSLKITVEERWYFLGFPEVLLADRSFNEWYYDRDRDFSRISYGINLKHFNLTGNNDQLKFKALGGFIPYYEVGYLKPYIDKRKRIGIRIAMYYSTQRSMPYRTWNDKLDFIKSDQINRKRLGGMFEVRLKNALYHFHAINLGFLNTRLSDTIALLNPNNIGVGLRTQNLFTFSYDYKFDQRDNRQYPLKGSLLNLQLNSLVTGKYNMINMVSRYSQFYPLGKKLFLSLSVGTKISSPKNQIYSLVSGLGYGGNVVRGYELFVIDGQHYAIQKTSLKYKLIDKTINLGQFIKIAQFKTLPIAVYPNVFFDAGFVKNYFPERSNSKLANTGLRGAGIGLDFVTWYSTNFKMYVTRNHINQTGFFFGLSRDY
jgi:outer membrane protein assembly factor BamA